jgi:hypothetical protein
VPEAARPGKVARLTPPAGAGLTAVLAAGAIAPVAVVLDNAASHRSKQIAWSEGKVPLRLPASSPELNPAEHLFRSLRQQLANRILLTGAKIEAALTVRHQARRRGLEAGADAYPNEKRKGRKADLARSGRRLPWFKSRYFCG